MAACEKEDTIIVDTTTASQWAFKIKTERMADLSLTLPKPFLMKWQKEFRVID